MPFTSVLNTTLTMVLSSTLSMLRGPADGIADAVTLLAETSELATQRVEPRTLTGNRDRQPDHGGGRAGFAIPSHQKFSGSHRSPLFVHQPHALESAVGLALALLDILAGLRTTTARSRCGRLASQALAVHALDKLVDPLGMCHQTAARDFDRAQLHAADTGLDVSKAGVLVEFPAACCHRPILGEVRDYETLSENNIESLRVHYTQERSKCTGL